MKLLTPEEASELLNIKSRQIKEMARQGKIPAKKVGKFWRFPDEHLCEWIQGELRRNEQLDIDSVVDRIIGKGG